MQEMSWSFPVFTGCLKIQPFPSVLRTIALPPMKIPHSKVKGIAMGSHPNKSR